MNETFKILAMYKDNDVYKLVVGNCEDKYEMVLGNDKEGDYLLLNMFSLTNEKQMDIDTLKKMLTISVEVLDNEYVFDSTDKLRLKIKTTDKNYETILDNNDLIAKDYGYDFINIDRINPLEKLEGIFELSGYTWFDKNDDKFLEQYETKYLRNHRLYRLQRVDDVLSWDEYFMALSKLTSMRSKDPNTQVGACIVGPHHKILSIGYNGAPRGIEDDYFPWARKGSALNTKYMFVCHAEMNAISNYNGPRSDFDGATLYVDLFPCNECAKLIIQAGIKNVIYLSDKYANTDSTIASKKMFDLSGVDYKQLKEENQKTITLSLNPKDK